MDSEDWGFQEFEWGPSLMSFSIASRDYAALMSVKMPGPEVSLERP